MKLRLLAVIVTLFLFSMTMYATNYSLNFKGINLHVVGEYISASLATEPWQFAGYFSSGSTISGSITYNTEQMDMDPSNWNSLYTEGNLAIYIPQLYLTATRTSSSVIQISVFDNNPPGTCTHDDDQFFASVEGSVSFSSTPVIPTPHRFHVFLFGDPSMLPDDQLPTAPLDWLHGDASFFFMDSSGIERQVKLQYTPSVPEPASLLLLGTGLCGLLLSTRSRLR